MKRCNFHLQEDRIESLAEVSGRLGMSKAEVVRLALDAFFHVWSDVRCYKNKRGDMVYIRDEKT